MGWKTVSMRCDAMQILNLCMRRNEEKSILFRLIHWIFITGDLNNNEKSFQKNSQFELTYHLLRGQWTFCTVYGHLKCTHTSYTHLPIVYTIFCRVSCSVYVSRISRARIYIILCTTCVEK